MSLSCLIFLLTLLKFAFNVDCHVLVFLWFVYVFDCFCHVFMFTLFAVRCFSYFNVMYFTLRFSPFGLFGSDLLLLTNNFSFSFLVLSYFCFITLLILCYYTLKTEQETKKNIKLKRDTNNDNKTIEHVKIKH